MPQAEGPCSAASRRRGCAARIGDQVDVALPPQLHVLGPVPRDADEAHRGENGFQHALFGRGKFDELEAVEAQRVFEQVSHGSPQHALRMWRTV
jgi:hypothetical protein